MSDMQGLDLSQADHGSDSPKGVRERPSIHDRGGGGPGAEPSGVPSAHKLGPADFARQGLSGLKLKKIGFRSRNPEAYTNAERQARWKAKHGYRMVRAELSVEAAAALLYLRQQWGFKSNRELVNVAIRFLAVETRKGRERLELTID